MRARVGSDAADIPGFAGEPPALLDRKRATERPNRAAGRSRTFFTVFFAAGQANVRVILSSIFVLT
jgi:hypothetical protein